MRAAPMLAAWLLPLSALAMAQSPPLPPPQRPDSTVRDASFVPAQASQGALVIGRAAPDAPDAGGSTDAEAGVEAEVAADDGALAAPAAPEPTISTASAPTAGPDAGTPGDDANAPASASTDARDG